MNFETLSISVFVEGDDIRYIVDVDNQVKAGFMRGTAAKAAVFEAVMYIVGSIAADRLNAQLMDAVMNGEFEVSED